MSPHQYPFNLGVVLFATTLLISLASLSYGQDTKYNFYGGSCPNVESIVHAAIKKHFTLDPAIAPSLLRMHFHDCFVQGCDASILLNGTASEKTAFPNLSLRGFDAIDEAKKNLEDACPGIVSCADILALAARDSVMLTGEFGFGFGWAVPMGRRDGNVSLANNTNNLPRPTDSVAVQIQKFNALNLNTQDLVTLVGAHTIGTTACQSFVNRLYNYTSAGGADPTISQTFLPFLQGLCPQNGNGSVRVPLDVNSSTLFDNRYFGKLVKGEGVLESDQRLWSDNLTNPIVKKYLGPLNIGFIGSLVFQAEFKKSMVKMSNIGVLTGNQGQIRNVCYANNN